MQWTGTPALEEQIVAYEKVHGLSFPADYRTFLSTTNGGLAIGLDQTRRGVSRVARLFELDAAREEANLWSAQVRCATRIPPPLMPIGESANGDLFCIGLLGPRRGCVFAFDSKGRAIEIASTFGEFLEAVCDESRDVIPPRHHLRLVD